jgi:16S rRNA (cytidine1402-2'-O)-methyltransferase
VKADEILNLLYEGKNIALVSDAGLPCISDPGFLISKLALEKGYNVVSLPGASASLTALIASGLPNDKFYFNGFLNSKQSQRIKQLETLKDKEETMIIYEAPHRIIETLKDIYNVFGNRNVVVARELTKKFEEYTRGTLEEIINTITELKGEIVVIVEGSKVKSEVLNLNSLTIREHFDYYKAKGNSDNDAMKMVAKDRGVSKSEVYKEIKC